MKPPATKPPKSGRPEAPRRNRFEAAGGLVARQIRKAGESRGFAVARVLTHWPEVAGPDLARLCRPQRISYARAGFGATLVVEAPGAAAPLVSMRLEALRERINAVYGYAAIARIQLVQGGVMEIPEPASGMAEAPAAFRAGPVAPGLRSDNLAPPAPVRLARAQAMVEAATGGLRDPGLKAALEGLALNLISRDRLRPLADANDRKDTE